MPSLIDLRRRIRSVKNTQQITKAMKMDAASKLRRAQERVTNARPFATELQRMLRRVAARADTSLHPLLERRVERPDAKTLVIVVAGDKGLCGSFNTNIIKAASAFVTEHQQPCVLGLIGRKARDYFGRRGFPVLFDQVGVFQNLRFVDAELIGTDTIEAFVSGEVDRVILIYNEFKSVMQQRVAIEQVLPIPTAEVTSAGAPVPEPETLADGVAVTHLYEPSPLDIFNELLPRYVEVMIYRALLESNAAFFASQMTAMDTATKNSADMIAGLTLYMNKVRQAAITREIIEVVSGAQAL